MGFDAIIRLGPMALLAALVAMIYLYRHNRQRHATAAGAPPSLVAYVGVALVVGALAYIAGAALGIYAACSSPRPGSLCGLYGVFGLGPLLSAIAIFAYALFWTKRAWRAREAQ